jgi:hypothetical protein
MDDKEVVMKNYLGRIYTYPQPLNVEGNLNNK